MKVLITGGSGLIGKALSRALLKQGHEVTVLSTHLPKTGEQGVTYLQIDLLKDPLPQEILLSDAIIHLAGAPISHRWTSKYKKQILESRIKSAERIYEVLKEQRHTMNVKSFISASAVGFYGDRGDEILDEKSHAGTDFLASVCIRWEEACHQFSTLGIRTLSIRTATVISNKGGILAKLSPVFRKGLGSYFGSGSQWFSWIHIDDLVKLYLLALSTPSLHGVINAVAPQAVTQKTFMKELGHVLHRPVFLSIPTFLTKCLLGEMAALVLSSQKMISSRLHEYAFHFSYPTLQTALLIELDQK